VFVGFLDPDDVNDLVAVRNFERELRVAKLTVELFELVDHLAPVDFHLPLGLKPASQALQVDQSHCSRAFAWRNQRIKVIPA
jgi:hypothetical protein